MFLDIFNELLAERGLNRKQFAEQSGIPYPTVIGWTNLNRLPDFTALGKLADFFGCSVDYLMGREGLERRVLPMGSASEEQQLIACYRNLDGETRQLLLQISKKLSE